MDAVRSDKRVIETSTVSSIQIFSTIEKVCTEEFEEDNLDSILRSRLPTNPHPTCKTVTSITQFYFVVAKILVWNEDQIILILTQSEFYSTNW
jgi:hypothetical protein